MRDKAARPSPQAKAAKLSPELDEVLRMLRALEEQPEADRQDSGNAR
jgi:hypothetical protein